MELLLNETIEYDLPYIIRQYFLEKVARIRTPLDAKVLLLDRDSARILNSVCTISDLTASGIALVENVSIRRKPLPKMDAIYFVTPNEQVVDAIIQDFEDPEKPMYNTAHIFFTSALDKKLMTRIAQERVVSRIKTFKEANIDFLVQESQVFVLESENSFFNLYSPVSELAQREQIKISNKLVTLCATLGEFPYIRYTKSSGHASGIAAHVLERLEKLRKSKVLRPQAQRAVLLILDRVDDLVSPLLHEFTYQAMVYDLLNENIRNNCYKYTFKNADDKEEVSEMPLDETDKIWKCTRHQHIESCKKWIASTFKEFEEKRKAQKAEKEKIDSDTLQEMVRSLPKYRILRKKISFHVNLAHRVFKVFEERCLEEIAAVEQDLATGKNIHGKEPKNARQRVKELLTNEKLREDDKIRLLLLWAVTAQKVTEHCQELIEAGHFTHENKVTQTVKNLLTLKSISSRKDQRRAPKHGDWEYDLSRYTPFLKDILENLFKGTLSTQDFPYLNKENDAENTSIDKEPLTVDTPKNQKSKRKAGNQTSKWQQNNTNTNTASVTSVQKREGTRLIVFVVGGVTYSEIRVVYEVSKAKNRDIIIGSTHILTPDMFVKEVSSLHDGIKENESEEIVESSDSESRTSEIFSKTTNNTNTKKIKASQSGNRKSKKKRKNEEDSEE